MMTEKSAQRAFHGHLLVDRCLNYIEVSDVINANPEVAEKIEQAEEIYTTVKNGGANPGICVYIWCSKAIE